LIAFFEGKPEYGLTQGVMLGKKMIVCWGLL
jgi:hypothetical protein